MRRPGDIRRKGRQASAGPFRSLKNPTEERSPYGQTAKRLRRWRQLDLVAALQTFGRIQHHCLAF